MRNSAQIAVVADDLTGALDSVVPFVNAGLRCVVATDPDRLQDAMRYGADVVAVSTNSREISQTDAVGLMFAVAAQLSSIPMVIKKIDSRLKGHVGAETVALAQALGLHKVLVCPAIPDMQRIVQDGQVRGFGIDQPISVAAQFRRYPDIGVAVPDAQTDADIDQIVAGASGDTMLVGARGLSLALARRLQRGVRRSPAPMPLPLPIAFAIGSRDPITLAQVLDLRRHRPECAYLAAPNGTYCGQVPPSDVAVMQAVPGAEPATPAEVTSALAACFVRDLVAGRACIALTGGETATAVLQVMGIGVLLVLGEPIAGLPLCQPLDVSPAPLVLTKSGGFGAADAFSRLLQPTFTIIEQNT